MVEGVKLARAVDARGLHDLHGQVSLHVLNDEVKHRRRGDLGQKQRDERVIISSSRKKTLPILIAQLRSADFLKFDMGKVYMFIAIAIVPVIVVYLLLSRFIVAGVTVGGVKE